MSPAIPDHPAIVTRQAVERRQQARGGRWEPVALPTYRRRPAEVLSRYWRAVWPSLAGLAFLIIAVATAGGWIAVVAS